MTKKNLVQLILRKKIKRINMRNLDSKRYLIIRTINVFFKITKDNKLININNIGD